MDEQRTKVGVGVMILKDGKVLMSKRKGSHGTGEYAFPGGHLEYMESFYDCAKREVKEECGIAIENIRFQYLSNITSYAPKQYAHISLVADWKSGELVVLEPERSGEWTWYGLDHLPEPMFVSCRLSFHSMKTGQTFYDIVDVERILSSPPNTTNNDF